MQSKAGDVASYIDEAPAERQEALRKLHLLCRRVLKGLSVGKGCIRYARPEKFDFAVIEQMLIATRDSTGEVC